MAVRWPGVLQSNLGDDFKVIEDGVNGRTAVADSSLYIFDCSKTDLLSSIEHHRPLDLIILMLGTNDLLKTSSESPSRVGEGIGVLMDIIRQSGAGPEGRSPATLLLAPPPFGDLTGESAALERAKAQSYLLAERYASIAEEFGCEFLDTGEHIRSSDVDGLHLDASEHIKLGLVVARRVWAFFTGAE